MTAILAGGTQVVSDLERRARPQVDAVIDIGRLGLSGVRASGVLLRAGATTTLTDLIENETAAALAGGLLVHAARGEGPPNLRNAMTLGGIVAGAQTDSEVYAALLALGASVIVTGRDAPVLLADFAAGAGLITEILIPLDDLRAGCAPRTHAVRPADCGGGGSGRRGPHARGALRRGRSPHPRRRALHPVLRLQGQRRLPASHGRRAQGARPGRNDTLAGGLVCWWTGGLGTADLGTRKNTDLNSNDS